MFDEGAFGPEPRPSGLAIETRPHYYRCGRRGAPTERPGVTLDLVVNQTRFNLEARRGKTAALMAALGSAFGASPCDAPRTVAVGAFDFVGIAPARWHAISRLGALETRAAMPRETLRDLATIVDVSHGFTVFRLQGAMVVGALTRLVRLDLDSDAFPPGSCVTTELHGMAVQLRSTIDGQAYECAVSRSFGGSLFHALTHAADPFGVEVGANAEPC